MDVYLVGQYMRGCYTQLCGRWFTSIEQAIKYINEEYSYTYFPCSQMLIIQPHQDGTLRTIREINVPDRQEEVKWRL